MIGETIGKYRVVARLGGGGMGTVYRAVDETLARDVAIKVLNPGLTDSDLLKRFRAEAMTLARLNHQNIATLYELGHYGDELLMVMEFVRGETFEKLSERVGPMPFERAGDLCAQVLDALGHAHRVGVVHRDMKPANLMLAESGVVKVMDFGIARMVGAEHLTNDGFRMGTPAYMAPEQVMGNEVDGRADLYGVGVILFRLLTSHLPFKADTADAMVQKQIKDPPTPLRQFRAELPVWCEQILDRALAKPPEARYQTAEEFRSALMLSVALAPATEVTSALAARGRPARLEMPIARDPMPTPVILPREPVATAPPGIRAAAVPPSSAASARAIAPGVVFTPIAPPPPAPPTRGRTTTGASSAAGQTGASKKVYVGIATAATALAIAAVFVVPLRGPSQIDRRDTPPPSPVATASQPASPVSRAQPGLEPPGGSAPAAAASAPVAVPPPVPQQSSVSRPAATPRAAAPAAPRDLRGRAGAERRPGVSSGRSPGPAPESRPILPSLTFAPVRFLVHTDARPSERDASLTFSRDALAVTENTGTGEFKSVPYSAVIAVFHSRSREPQWIGPTGIVLPIAKMGGGMFGFLKRDRDWVSVRTKSEFVTLRPDAALVARVIAAIEARTGLTTVRVGKRSDDKD